MLLLLVPWVKIPDHWSNRKPTLCLLIPAPWVDKTAFYKNADVGEKRILWVSRGLALTSATNLPGGGLKKSVSSKSTSRKRRKILKQDDFFTYFQAKKSYHWGIIHSSSQSGYHQECRQLCKTQWQAAQSKQI